MVQHTHHYQIFGNHFNPNHLTDIENSHSGNFDGAYCGILDIHSQKVAFVIQDIQFKGGSIGKIQNKQITATIDAAVIYKAPLVFVFASGGARIQEGVENMVLCIRNFKKIALTRDIIPIIGIVNGIAVGLTAYFASLCDVCIFVKNKSQAFMTGPKVIEAVLGQKVNFKELGNAESHAEITGLATHLLETEDEIKNLTWKLIDLFQTKKILSFEKREFEPMLPDDNRYAYNMQTVIDELVDRNSFIEFQKLYAKNIITGIASFYGLTIGIVANQPKYFSGAMDTLSSLKLSKFTELCNRRKIPMIFLLDCPGFLPGNSQEKLGIINAGSKAATTLIESSNLKISVILRRLTGGAVLALNSSTLSADYVFMWDAADITYIRQDIGKELTKFVDDTNNTRKDLLQFGLINEIIHPEDTPYAIYQKLKEMIDS